jgi:hypothetical protein
VALIDKHVSVTIELEASAVERLRAGWEPVHASP